jgi:transposase
MAVLKRLKFAAQSEAFNAEQKSLLEETIDTDLAALAAEIERQQPSPQAQDDKQKPKRQRCPRTCRAARSTTNPRAPTCTLRLPACKRIGEDVAEKLDYVPGVFTVERHIRGKWVCQVRNPHSGASACARHRQGHPTAGLLAQVLVAKYADHLPLYRQEASSPRRAGTAALDAGAVGRAMRRAVAAAGRCAAR